MKALARQKSFQELRTTELLASRARTGAPSGGRMNRYPDRPQEATSERHRDDATTGRRQEAAPTPSLANQLPHPRERLFAGALFRPCAAVICLLRPAFANIRATGTRALRVFQPVLPPQHRTPPGAFTESIDLDELPAAADQCATNHVVRLQQAHGIAITFHLHAVELAGLRLPGELVVEDPPLPAIG